MSEKHEWEVGDRFEDSEGDTGHVSDLQGDLCFVYDNDDLQTVRVNADDPGVVYRFVERADPKATSEDPKFILDIYSRSSTRNEIQDRQHKASNAALVGIMFEVFDAPKTHKDGDTFVITESDGAEVGRGPTEQAAIYEAIKAEHRRMVTRLRKSDAFRKSMREFVEGR